MTVGLLLAYVLRQEAGWFLAAVGVAFFSEIPESSEQGGPVVGLGPGLPPMARKLRLEYAGAAYQVMAAANKDRASLPTTATANYGWKHRGKRGPD